MDTYNAMPKQYAEQINIWYSETLRAWVVCAWVRQVIDNYFNEEVVYKKERKVYPSMAACLEHIARHYKEN